MPKAAVVLYRQILRRCRELQRMALREPQLCLQNQILPQNIGRYYRIRDVHVDDTLLNIGFAREDLASIGLPGRIPLLYLPEAARLIRRRGTAQMELGFKALQLLAEQPAMLASTVFSKSYQHNVHVTASAVPVRREGTTHSWCYRIRVDNRGDDWVQVRGRDWTFLNSSGMVEGRVLKGSRWSVGVVGGRPVIPPDSCFVYFSAVDMTTKTGKAIGSLQLMVVDPEEASKSSWGWSDTVLGHTAEEVEAPQADDDETHMIRPVIEWTHESAIDLFSQGQAETEEHEVDDDDEDDHDDNDDEDEVDDANDDHEEDDANDALGHESVITAESAVPLSLEDVHQPFRGVVKLWEPLRPLSEQQQELGKPRTRSQSRRERRRALQKERRDILRKLDFYSDDTEDLGLPETKLEETRRAPASVTSAHGSGRGSGHDHPAAATDHDERSKGNADETVPSADAKESAFEINFAFDLLEPYTPETWEDLEEPDEKREQSLY